MIYSDLHLEFCPYCGSKVKTKYYCHSCNKSFQLLTEYGAIDPDLISEIKWNDEITYYQKKIILEILSECVKIDGGSFTMGTNNIDRKIYEKKGEKCSHCPHRVTLSSFYISKFLVTQRQWFAFMPQCKCNNVGEQYPIDSISWHECIEFANKLKHLSGINFAIPTEAQWFFVAKECDDFNTNIYSGGNTLDTLAWTKQNSEGISHRPGLKTPNKLGIYDMSGNLSELCLDRWGEWDKHPQVNPYRPIGDGGNMVRKGGSFYYSNYCDEFLESYNINSRDCRSDNAKMGDSGFRLAIYDESILTEIK